MARTLYRALITVCLYFFVTNPATAQQADVEISASTYPARSAASLSNGSQLILMLDVPTLNRVVLAPEDVREATFRITLQNPPASGSLSAYRLSPFSHGPTFARTDFESKPFATLPFNTFVAAPSLARGARMAEIKGLGEAIGKALTESPTGLPLLLIAQTAWPDDKVTFNMSDTLLDVSVTSYPKTTLFTPPIPPAAGVYAHNRDGHLYYGDQRLRLWGCVRPQLPNIETADRIASMGFNAIRMWGPRTTDGSGPLINDTTGEFIPAVRGDGSQLDEYDRFFARAKTDGLFIMATGLTDAAHVSEKSEWLKGDGKHWNEWQQAMSAKPDGWIVAFMAAADERLYRARQQQVKDYLTHVNPYTGKDYAHEEAIAIYELANENAHVKRTLEKGFEKWPPYFVSELQQQWNAWLKTRYRNDAELTTAWGKLAGDEALQAGTVKLEPTAVDKAAYPAQRGSDFIRFLIELNGSLNKHIEAYARSFAPKGVGVSVIPFSYDTQYMPSNLWLFDNTQGADVANFGMYFWSLQNPLTKPPSMYVMDSSTVEGKITAIYETMDGRPDPYRAAYPYRLAALAGWEDWDAIFFHYWDGFQKRGHTYPDEQYMAGTLSYIAPSHYWTAVYYEKDPALLSAMAIAGQIFLHGAITPAPHPLTYVLGTKSIFDFTALGGDTLARATYSQGARIRFEPGNQDSTIAPVEQPNSAPTGAIHMGEQVLWDWPNGRLIIDTPTAKAYVGAPHGKYRFKDGIVVGGFDGAFVSLGIFSTDGKPLTGPRGTTNIYISAVNDARNTGYRIHYNEATDPLPGGGPLGIGKLIDSNGTAPIVADRVPYQIWFPTDMRGEFDGYDLARRQRLTHPVSGGHIGHDGSELYLAKVSIENTGGRTIATPQSDAIEPPAQVLPPVPADSPPYVSTYGHRDDPSKIWNPLPDVKWSDEITAVAGRLRRSGRPADIATLSSEHLQLTNTRALFLSASDIDIIYLHGQMSSINATFLQPPLLATVIAEYGKELGTAVETHVASSEDQITTVRWVQKQASATLTVVLTETQGTLGIVYSVTP